ncbi:hypothetical protein SPRG_11376 [Saprolegnia parasitica CBS 223.65]|uniref:Legume lectin domain-containing protein n=1 Tax=Saprolegnia parasitica (strain CBS 223.65) TaxID=695850 RepID=A0A067C9F3_SAPPC|nr:hypothetical protein SPRG_11376 [Saprolegnia parasitica CBS 223.65]KDO23447.1 hypothetical protein SPRG_11376 [Saprolegnia parasitica CBS 223.65]|eukprot:XP_012205772.1 hypothetical protein SPRG_11376 [Saprolegnia parasitica CBS 223.65]
MPLLSTDMAFAHHFQPSAYVSQLLPHWCTLGLGCLLITIDGLDVLSVPLHLDATLQLGMGGRAYVGFTAATGAATWQVHDILSWTFDANRLVF